jgi:predicted nucleic acid-binding protein
VTSRAVFLDTSGVYETADRNGRRHEATVAAFQQLLADAVPLLTTDLVLAELHGLTLGRLGPEIALDLVDRLSASSRLEVLATGPDVLRAAIELLRLRPGRRLSLVDASSFLVMRAHDVGTALALDTDFVAEGFSTLP